MKSETISRAECIEATLDEGLNKAISQMMSVTSVRAERIHGGGNNIVARVDAAGKTVCAKIYFRHADDQRDRLRTEFGMLSFLWRSGVRCIPEPLAEDTGHHIGLYEFIDGQPLLQNEISGSEIDQLISLLVAMWRLRSEPAALGLPDASDSAFSLVGHIERVRSRIEKFLSPGMNSKVLKFVQDEVTPLFEASCRRIEEGASKYGLKAQAGPPLAERTLSPADHGFHNALRRRDGQLVFLDFEYAGWDDPAQMIGNGCYQPAVRIPVLHRERFVQGMLSVMEDDRVRRRLDLIDPLLGIKWSLIMLNEFLPVDESRRRFAGKKPEETRGLQLEKARQQADEVRVLLKSNVGM